MELELETAKLNFETQGNKNNPPLVLWHGAGCTLRMWDFVVKELKKEFYTIAFDVRGAGKSVNLQTDQAQYSFEQYSQDLNAILDFLSLEKVHIWSMAWGTRAAIAYSSMFTHKVISAVFSDASIGIADIKAQKFGLKDALEKQKKAGIEKFKMPEGWNIHLNQESASLSLQAAGKFNLTEAIKNISFPYLVMTGDHDPNLSSSKDIVKNSISGELKILESVGHGSVLQRPDLTSKSFLEWHKQIKLIDA